MDRYETSTHSFIVKIWLEEPGGKAGAAVWRGRVTHVPGGERRHVRDLAGITDFIAPYVASFGAPTPGRRRLRRWFGARPGKHPPAAGPGG